LLKAGTRKKLGEKKRGAVTHIAKKTSHKDVKKSGLVSQLIGKRERKESIPQQVGGRRNWFPPWGQNFTRIKRGIRPWGVGGGKKWVDGFQNWGVKKYKSWLVCSEGQKPKGT